MVAVLARDEGTYDPGFPRRWPARSRSAIYFNMEDHVEHSVRHVDTELMFWRATGGDNRVQVDFTNGNPEEGVKAMHAYDQMHHVRVKDLRGQESTFTLDKNGFAYVSHEMPGDATDEEQVKGIIIPQTEEIVRQVSVLLLLTLFHVH